MKLTFKIILVFLILASVFASCNDPIDRSVDNKTVTILAPLDNTISEIYLQTFWWEEVKDASQYRFQMVRNKFDQNPVFYMDTIVNKNIFKVTIDPGVYQWRVYAENGNSKSNTATVQNLKIDSTSIEGQDVILTSPVDNFSSKEKTINFKWQKLAGAKEYIINIDSIIGSKKIITKVVTTNSFEHSFQNDGKYIWTIQATNKLKSTASNISDPYKITIDTKSEVVTLLSPEIKDSVVTSSNVELKWKKPVDDVVYYIIKICKNDKLSLYDGYPRSTERDSSPDKLTYIFTKKPGDTVIFWSVIAVDRAGNQSEESAMRKIEFK